MTIADRSMYSRNQHLTFKANMGAGRHGWLRLTPAYGVRLVRDRVSHLPEGSTITDPFSGTGTTPLAAAELGHNGQSMDVNPFLIWLGTVKTTHYSDDVLDLASRSVQLVVSTGKGVLGDKDLWQPSLFKIERWWNPPNLDALKAIRYGIDATPVPPEVKSLFEIALCRVLIARSNAAFNHQSMSFKEEASSGTLFDTNEAAEALAAFEAEARTIVASARYDLLGQARIIRADSRHSVDDLAPCDLMLTSPPYANRMSYIRELRPYMYWLRFLDQAGDAGDLDWQAIGGTWGTATSKLNTWQHEVETPVDGPMSKVCSAIRTDGGKNGPLLATYVHKYFHDMWLHFQSMKEHVKVGGTVSYIVGNSTFYGHIVPAQDWYAEMLRALDYQSVEVETIRKRNSNKALYEYDVRGIRT